MITDFESITHELTEKELISIVPIVSNILKDKIGKEKITTSVKILKHLDSLGLNTPPARLRKVISYIRTFNVVNLLIATSKGYYVASKKEEVDRFIESLDQRANQIILVRDAIKYQLETTNLKLCQH